METFRNYVLNLMHHEYRQVPAAAGPGDASISIGSTIVNLDNIHSKVRLLASEDRESAVLEFLSMAMESHRQSMAGRDLAWSEGRKLLRPRLMANQVFDAVADIVRQPFAPGVVVAYAIDHGRIVSFAKGSDLKRWKVGLKRVHDTAVRHLDDLSEEVEIDVRFARGGGALATIETNDSYDAARLVLPRFRARLLAALGAPVFIGIPNRDFLVA